MLKTSLFPVAMPTFSVSAWRVVAMLCLCLCLGMAQAATAGPDTNSAASLRAQYAELSPQLGNNQFKRPLVLHSTESANQLKGDIYAQLDYPFAAVNQALNDPTHWCDVLILHINTKYCHALTSPVSSTLLVNIGKKDFQPLDQAYRVEFAYRTATTTPEYFNIGLDAETGPLGTSNYRLRLEAVSIPGDKTFLHLTYSYAFDFTGRLAMQGYLLTAGSGKVGFTNTDPRPGSPPSPIGGVRGVVERNTMRYYLAIDAYLGALSAPPADQLEKRLQSWFTSTERYPRQLHEVDRGAYLDMKRSEYLRQQQRL